jgi:hypothetical protein
MESSCERCNESSGSIKMLGIYRMHNLWPLEWYSAPHSYLLTYLVSSLPSMDACTILKEQEAV